MNAARALPVPQALGLSASGLTKRFGSFTALENVSLDVTPGSVHALLGENGAGKSTLVKCIMGYYAADAGEVRVDGAPVAIANPKDAHRLGLGMVYQHFTLVPSMTVAENLVMSRLVVPAVIDWRKERAALEAFLDRMPFKVPLDRPGRRARRRRAAEDRDPQAALAGAQVPDPRRADLGADARRGRRDAGPAARHGAATGCSPS